MRACVAPRLGWLGVVIGRADGAGRPLVCGRVCQECRSQKAERDGTGLCSRARGRVVGWKVVIFLENRFPVTGLGGMVQRAQEVAHKGRCE